MEVYYVGLLTYNYMVREKLPPADAPEITTSSAALPML
jgi:hypothetical protein